jgi:hypothetical protein
VGAVTRCAQAAVMTAKRKITTEGEKLPLITDYSRVYPSRRQSGKK